MWRRVTFFGICIALLAALSMRIKTSFARESAPVPWRSFEFTYIVHVPTLPPGSGSMGIWIPLAQTDTHQRVSGLRVVSPVRYRVTRGGQSGNEFAYLNFNAARGHAPFDIRLTFDARREEYKVALPASETAKQTSLPPSVARFLLPDRLIPIDGMIGKLSREQTADIQDPLQRARKIYEYVIAHMHYDHDGTGWGHGDAIFACTKHHGNCTDFHSLFIGMARAAGIPARFEIGFAIPQNEPGGEIAGYHCWAEFYIQGTGWVPIDASEAWQNPARHDFYFGTLDADRVRLASGRDLTLTPRQAGGPVNYIVYPYAELNGKPYDGLTHEVSFRYLQTTVTAGQ
jgi:transglutaminase-like putative cysteine protease